MTDRDDADEMRDRMSQRFGDEGESGADTSDKNSKTDKNDMSDTTAKSDTTEKTAQSEESSQTVKDRPSVLMYLPPDVRERLSIKYDEMNIKAKRQQGEGIGKNEDFYPAVIEAGLEHVEEVLEFEESENG